MRPLPETCRYEVNPELVPQFEAAGLRFVGKDDTGTRMEIVELAGHPFFVAAQVPGAVANGQLRSSGRGVQLSAAGLVVP
jgi:CTP synthase (UTP-ammonia lyase)